MTLEEAKKVVKAMGLLLSYDHEFKEYAIYSPHAPSEKYFTDYLDDAIATARWIADYRKQSKDFFYGRG